MKKFLNYILSHCYAYDILCFSYVVLALILSFFTPLSIDYKLLFDMTYDTSFLELVFAYILIDILFVLFRISRDKANILKKWFEEIRQRYLNLEKLVHIIKALFWLKIVLLIYCNIKQSIPLINPILCDKELALFDSLLFLGYNPNRIFVDIFAAAHLSAFLDLLYFLWYILKPFVLVYFAVLPVRRRILHQQFFFAYYALWMSGGFAALILPSLGPVYTMPDLFRTVNRPIALKLQARLFRHYIDSIAHPEHFQKFIYEGIAAFPSLHIGIIALFAFFLFRVNRIIGFVMFIYLVVVQIGSVVLGWHYFIDGVAGILLAWLLYFFTTSLMHSDRAAVKKCNL